MGKTALSKTDTSNQRWIRAKQGEDRYPWCRNTLMKYAEEAGAVKHVGPKMVMIDTIRLDAYIEAQAASEK